MDRLYLTLKPSKRGQIPYVRVGLSGGKFNSSGRSFYHEHGLRGIIKMLSIHNRGRTAHENISDEYVYAVGLGQN